MIYVRARPADQAGRPPRLPALDRSFSETSPRLSTRALTAKRPAGQTGLHEGLRLYGLSNPTSRNMES